MARRAWQRFWTITWPMLAPTTFFVTTISLISSFQVFDQVFVMTGGGPVGATTTMVQLIYKNAFSYSQMGYASAISWILFALIFAVTRGAEPPPEAAGPLRWLAAPSAPPTMRSMPCCCVGAMVMLLPFVWMVSTSLKTGEATFVTPPQLIPASPTIDNYEKVFGAVPMGQFLINSIFVSVTSTALMVLNLRHGRLRLRAHQVPRPRDHLLRLSRDADDPAAGDAGPAVRAS